MGKQYCWAVTQSPTDVIADEYKSDELFDDFHYVPRLFSSRFKAEDCVMNWVLDDWDPEFTKDGSDDGPLLGPRPQLLLLNWESAGKGCWRFDCQFNGTTYMLHREVIE